jgi:hypothetical protein
MLQPRKGKDHPKTRKNLGYTHDFTRFSGILMRKYGKTWWASAQIEFEVWGVDPGKRLGH